MSAKAAPLKLACAALVAGSLAWSCTQNFDAFSPTGDGPRDTTSEPVPGTGDATAMDSAADTAVADSALADAIDAPSIGDAATADASADAGADADATVDAPADAAVDALPDAPSDGPADGPSDAIVSLCATDAGVTFGGRCYFATAPPPAVQLTWDQARLHCEANGAHLVTVGTAAEQAFAVTLLGGRDRWIGLRRPAMSPTGNNSFTWVNGEPRAYANWGQNEPNGSGECVRIRGTGGSTGMWADQTCTTLVGAICEQN